jgi:FAD/FMN-containing dehydrogenase
VRPPLARSVTCARQRRPDPAAVAALAAELAARLGAGRVGTGEAVRRAASADFAFLSPVLTEALPDAVADVVAFPGSAAEIAAVVSAAARHGVALTPRGRGTGNYGQAVPLAGGLVLDTTGAARVLEIADGRARVEAGTSFVALEAAARRHGQELALMPTTVGSTVGGFIAGGAGGVGSVEHGWIWDGFVTGLEVACPGATGLERVEGERCAPFLHGYGVTGVIATATVRLAPARTWAALLASFPAWPGAVAAGRTLLGLDPPPRLLCVDEPALVATYPRDRAMPPDRVSVRAIVAGSAVDHARAAVTAAGGRVEAVRPRGAGYLTSLAFNHVTLRARRDRPDLAHLQVGGPALVERADEVRLALPGAMLHLDGLRDATGPAFGGLLLAPYRGVDELYAGVDALRALGVVVVDPHTWLLGGPALPAIVAAAARNDPAGLLNPGKLPPPG